MAMEIRSSTAVSLSERSPIPLVQAQSQPVLAAAEASNSSLQDKVHFNTRGSSIPPARISFAEPQASARDEFGSAVRVDATNHREMKTLLRYFSLTPDQERQLKAAEARAFDRFMSHGYSPERGSLQAKIRQAAQDTYTPGYSVHHPTWHISEGEKNQIKDALQKYAEDVASIAITGRSRKDLQRYVEDKFFITLFDRDKEEFEEYFKRGFQNFAADQTSELSADQATASPPAAIPSGSTESTPISVPVPEAEKFRWRFLRPRIGINVRGLDFEKVKLKPKVDLVQVRGPAQTEVRISAEVPFEFGGKTYPEAEITARRLFNAKPGEYGTLTQNIYAETRTQYNFHENRLDATVGVRKQISPDASIGMYGLYSQSFGALDVKDLGIGVSYQSRFE